MRINRQMSISVCECLMSTGHLAQMQSASTKGPLHPESVCNVHAQCDLIKGTHLLVSIFGPSVAFPAPVTVSPTMPDREQAYGPNLPHFRVPKSVGVEKHRMSLTVVRTVQ